MTFKNTFYSINTATYKITNGRFVKKFLFQSMCLKIYYRMFYLHNSKSNADL